MLELSCAQVLSVLPNDPAWTETVSAVQTLDHHLRQRETALTSAEHRVELLRTRLENDASTTQKAAQAVEAERADIKVINCFLLPTCMDLAMSEYSWHAWHVKLCMLASITKTPDL